MKRLVSIVLSASICTVGALRAEEPNRLAREAAALFRVVVASEAPPRRCQFGSDWMSRAVPEDIARKFLGLTLHADLTPPFQITRFQEILDPQMKQANAFCDDDAEAAYEEAQFEAFANDKSAKMVRIEHTAFSFPIFDAAYERAVVIVERSGLERDRLDMKLGRMNPGDILRHPGFGASFATVYRKSQTGWKLIASEVIDQS